MSDWLPSETVRSTYAAVVGRLPPRLRLMIDRMLSRWPGRMAIRSAVACTRIEIFDRSMTIAAQAFTSIFPILIVGATWLGTNGSQMGKALGVPEQSQSVLDEAMAAASGNQAFGIVGTLAVLTSATSFSRALTRAFAAIWGLPRPTSRLRSAWRWVAIVLALTLALVIARALDRYLSHLPPATFWEMLGIFAVAVAVAVFVPVTLLVGAVRPRYLLPGAVIFGVVMLLVRPASTVLLPHALEVSEDRYGSIGVAFTYVAWLYVMSFCLLVATVIGQVIATDEGRLGQWLRGSEPGGSAD